VQFKPFLSLAAATLMSMAPAQAAPPPRTVVAVQYQISELNPERIEQTVTNPLERQLIKLPMIADVKSSTGHGTVTIEIAFHGGASDQDLAAVNALMDDVKLAPEVVVKSRTVRLGAPRLP
jgi:multidrug efflux pump subunit AcrB